LHAALLNVELTDMKQIQSRFRSVIERDPAEDGQRYSSLSAFAVDFRYEVGSGHIERDARRDGQRVGYNAVQKSDRCDSEQVGVSYKSAGPSSRRGFSSRGEHYRSHCDPLG